jgi:ABC-2 type transport system ATP-binding protein
MSFLAFDQIHKSYGDSVALRGVSFEVREGEIFGLLGPNGAGKTTLMRILMDIIRADSGGISLFGEPHRREHLDRLGYLPEERGLYTKQPVLTVMTYFGTLKGLDRREARRRALYWLERIGLPEVAGWRVERLSKGMSQKVQIAATLVTDPDLCVLDEPSTGLDPVNVRLVSELIRERRNNGKTTILSTHQMNQVEDLCDRVALIHKGSLMVYGEVAEVRRRYSLPEVRVCLEGELPFLTEVQSAHSEGNSTWRLRLCDGTRPADVLAALVRAGAGVERFEKVLAPMEDIFIRVVGEAKE